MDTNADQTTASSDAASAPPRAGFTLRGRKWVYGATLAAAGVIAGSGVTYAVVSETQTVSPTAQSAQAQGAQPDETTGRPAGGPPGGAPPGGAAPTGG